ncbi:MAG: hypothetical protein GF330_12615 [Candidatus Eisenbacteria bacterium]|nr:hypothetical protein [Candidatus Eisenbacteria bacterium]
MSTSTERIAEGLERAMQAETEGYYFYKMAAQSTADAKGRQTFEDLAQEEREHFEFLRDQRRAVQKSGAPDAQRTLGKPRRFTGDHPIFSEEIQKRVGSAHYEMTALAIGIQLELSSIRFYREEAEAVEDAAAQAFYRDLAEWEQGHLSLLQRQADALKEEYWHAAHFAPF